MLTGDLLEFFQDKLESLRIKILDFSRSNPLINTRMGTNYQNYIRVVDEHPEVILNGLEFSEFELTPLPTLEDEPKDELNSKFENRFKELLVTDELYFEELLKLEEEKDTSQDSLQKAQRELKDRIREELKMPPRVKRDSLNLRQHAKNNDINPNYDLPIPEETHDDGRYSDNKIQTLLLQKDLERLAGRIFSRGRSSELETGINTLHAAFGFLEWIELDGEQENLSPLVILPLNLQKKSSAHGIKYVIDGIGEKGRTNRVLKEKLKQQYQIEFPEFDGTSIENYFITINNLKPKSFTKWNVKRFINFGNFPSAQMSMFNDLKFDNHDYENNQLVQDLLIGTDTSLQDYSFAEDYNNDIPKIENEVPNLVLDADSSQFSALVDIQRGKNLAIEGPPGTGKSQTIVNAIVSAIASGKKVLFVAQKLAALEVVLARIKSLGLDDFILPLQDTRTSRGKLITSIKKRIEISERDIKSELGNDYIIDHQANIDNFRDAREKLLSYLNILKTEIIEGYSVYDVFGKNIRLSEIVLSQEQINQFKINNSLSLSKNKIVRILDDCKELEAKWTSCKNINSLWSQIKLVNVNKFVIDEILSKSLELSRSIDEFVDLFPDYFNEEGIIDNSHYIQKSKITNNYHYLKDYLRDCDIQFSLLMIENNGSKLAQDYLDLKIKIGEFDTNFKNLFIDPLSDDLQIKLKNDINELQKFDISFLNSTNLKVEIDKLLEKQEKNKQTYNKLNDFYTNYSNLRKCSFKSIQNAHKIISETPETVIFLRDKKYENPNSISVLQTAIDQANIIKIKKDSLSNDFHVDRIPSNEVLVKHITYLQNASSFSFLSSDNKEAKSLFETVVKKYKFTKKYAIKFFQELSDFKKLEEKLFSNNLLKSLVGENYDGVNTDFQMIKKTCNFFETINNTFQQINDQPLIDFLKNQPLNILKSLPKLSENDLNDFSNFESIENEQNELNEQINIISTKIDFINSNFLYLKDKENTSTESLIKFEDVYKNYNQKVIQFNEIKNNKVFDKINLSNLNQSKLDHSIKLIKIIENLEFEKKETIQLIESNEIENVSQNFENFLKFEKAIKDRINNFISDYKLTNISTDTENLKFIEFSKYLEKASKERVNLENFANFNKELSNFSDKNVLNFIEFQLLKEQNLDGIQLIIDALIFRDLMIKIYDKFSNELSGYNGQNLTTLRKKVRELDKKIIESNCKKVKLDLLQNCSPDAGNGRGKPSTFTGMSLLHHEIERKAGHKSPRFLLDKAGDALLELMPCWTMPPLNIAKYLKSDFQKFDLCIIDEASQMIPGFALGALLRSKQCIIVGDVNQMPPDNTFTTNLNSVDQDEDLAMPEESILEIANVTFKPRRRLKWHYRSEDSSLIAFSNRYVYEDELILFPSSSENSKIDDMGVSLVKLDGIYKSSVNLMEATKIVEYAINFMKTHPRRSLGVVAMNLQQTDHILSLIDTAQNTVKHVRDYIDYWDKINEGLERFIVKNVASIQGDERDTILISTVYGPEVAGGPVAKRFGPINGNSGKRRLNVLFSRAKKQLVTFTSMKPSDLKVDKSQNEGVFLLGKWLEYSQTRVIDAGEQTNKKPDSDFEIYVMEQIEKLGYQAIPQVGVAGYFIDIGVKHPEWDYGYIMGVECDGRQYHSSLSARDRDRLRQNVLENLGWSFHRIWSTDWFNTRDQEINRLKKRLDEKLAELKASKSHQYETSIEELNIELRKEEISNLLLEKTNNQTLSKSNIKDNSEEITKEKIDAELEKTKSLKGTPAYNNEVSKILDEITEMIENQKTKNDIVTNSKFIEIQDQVTLEYLDGDKSVFQFTISEKQNDLENGIINQNMPIAKAVLDQEKGETIDVLVGVKRRKAIIKDIRKKIEK